ncbi:hypothetical protein FACS189452_03400 [Bacteroidia bacterium]|nr:hypothetical protein FACS189452_03400 [Bacteroidia bacterium]GHT80260.1 hypothetical protein FACS189467_2020 [Bacteroidia bacterium]
MKKILSLATPLVAVFMWSSCINEEIRFADTIGSGKMVNVTITAGVPHEIATYAVAGRPSLAKASHEGGVTNLINDPNYSLRYLLEVWTEDGSTLVKRDTFVVDQSNGYTSTNAEFDILLQAGTAYKFVFWADFTDASAPETDLHYQTDNAAGLKNITWITAHTVSDDSRDAYYYSGNITINEQGILPNIKLKRPFGKIRLVSTDTIGNGTIKAVGGSYALGIAPDSIHITTVNQGMPLPDGFDALSGSAIITSSLQYVTSGAIFSPIVRTARETVAGKSGAIVLAYDYMFPISGTTLSFGVQVFGKGGQDLGTRNISGIPVVANKLTTVIGNFSSSYDAHFSVIVSDGFAGGDSIVSVPGQFSGSAIAAANGGTIEIPTTYDTKFPSLLYTFATDPVNVVINDANLANPYTGTVYIGSGVGTITNLTVNLPGATVIVRDNVTGLRSITSAHTLKIESDASVGTLTIAQGNVDIKGTVTNLIIESGATADGISGGAPVTVTADYGRISASSITDNSARAKFFWRVATGTDFLNAVTIPTAKNHGTILTDNISTTADAVIRNSGYVLDGGGHTITFTGTVDYTSDSSSILSVRADSAIVKNLTIQTTVDTLSYGLRVINGQGIALQNVTVKNCGRAGIQVNGATVTATNVNTSNDRVWYNGGGIFVTKNGVNRNPNLTFVSGVIGDSPQIRTDTANNYNWTVKFPNGGWTGNKIISKHASFSYGGTSGASQTFTQASFP